MNPTSASIHRYVRRHVHKQSFDTFVACLPELENDTIGEIQHLIPGLMPSSSRGGVVLRATLPEIYRLNFGLSTANRILIRLANFPAWAFPMLFDNAKRIYWPAFVANPRQTSIHVTSRKSRLNMKQRIASTVHSAIEATFGTFEGATAAGGTSIYVRIVNDSVTVSLDTSGEHLHKRGDKVLTAVAPLRSTLASFALKPMLTTEVDTICDPFCGSGTILIEAARHQYGIAPGAKRAFAFMDHPYFRSGTWNQAKRDDTRHRRTTPHMTLVGGDARATAVDTARANLAVLGEDVAHSTSIGVRDFSDSLAASRAGNVAVVTNPPYGVRLGDRVDARQLQEALIDRLERFPTPLRFAVFSPFPDIYLNSKLRIEQVTPLQVGGLKIALVQGQRERS